MNAIVEEIARNLTGYALLMLGVVLMVGGMKWGLAGLIESGRGMVDAALLALQVKRIAEMSQPKQP